MDYNTGNAEYDLFEANGKQFPFVGELDMYKSHDGFFKVVGQGLEITADPELLAKVLAADPEVTETAEEIVKKVAALKEKGYVTPEGRLNRNLLEGVRLVGDLTLAEVEEFSKVDLSTVDAGAEGYREAVEFVAGYLEEIPAEYDLPVLIELGQKYAEAVGLIGKVEGIDSVEEYVNFSKNLTSEYRLYNNEFIKLMGERKEFFGW